MTSLRGGDCDDAITAALGGEMVLTAPARVLVAAPSGRCFWCGGEISAHGIAPPLAVLPPVAVT
jgi:hypothetical protein